MVSYEIWCNWLLSVIVVLTPTCEREEMNPLCNNFICHKKPSRTNQLKEIISNISTSFTVTNSAVLTLVIGGQIKYCKFSNDGKHNNYWPEYKPGIE